MGRIINDKEFINDNIFKYEKRLESQYTIFLEKNPTFVTYYHISGINSTTDNGFVNIDSKLGSDSPLKYQLIKDFPIYGIDDIKLDLSEEEEGLTSDYNGEGIILPNTVIPLPDDMFQISYLDNDYLFIVTGIDYDTIKSNNFYKISFSIKSLDRDSVDDINSQVFEKYICDFKNIGTEEKCIIEEGSYETILTLHKLYTDMVDRYTTLFYSKKFNSFIFTTGNSIIYDKFLTHFIMNNALFNTDDSYNTYMLTNEDYGLAFPVQYDDSIYRIIETRNIENLTYVRYMTTGITYQDSIFNYYNKLSNTKSVWFIDTGDNQYISDDIINAIEQKEIPLGTDILDDIFITYFIQDHNIYSIDIDRLKHYRLQYTFDDFVKVPMVLFMIKTIIRSFMEL